MSSLSLLHGTRESAAQKCFGYFPVLFDGARGDVQDFCDFFDPKACEESEFNDAGVAFVQFAQVSTLYNVYFYNDAAIMLPESAFELNNLLQMLQDNPNYRITLHGHTNGNAAGKIIKMGPSKNFFSLTDDVKNGIGSAKDLSRERAQVIKDGWYRKGLVLTEC